MTELFESNLRLLSEYDPILADLLRWNEPGGAVETFPTPAGAPSLRYKKDGIFQPIHSAHDPIREALRWAARIELNPPVYNVMIFGAGMMYHCFELV